MRALTQIIGSHAGRDILPNITYETPRPIQIFLIDGGCAYAAKKEESAKESWNLHARKSRFDS